ncbi:MAG: hypothetical protein KDA72_03575 [Planctomycetales bacterium]|nr:hypothetical protein [Planctomycetales bacterium]
MVLVAFLGVESKDRRSEPRPT